MLLHGAQLTGRGQAADIHIETAAADAVAQLASLLGQQVHELVVHRIHYIDAFHAATALPGILVAAPSGAVGGTLQIRVFEHQHGVIAAQLQGNRCQRLRGLSHQRFARRYRAGEEQLVDAVIEKAGGHFRARADNVLEQAFRKFAGRDDLFDGAAHCRGGGGHFQHHAIAGHQGHDDFAEGNRQGVVPGADDAHHAQWHAQHVGALVEEQDAASRAVTLFQVMLGVFRIPLAGQGTGQYFGGQGIGEGFAVALADSARQIIRSIDNVAAHHLDMTGPFLEGLGRPDGLRLAGLCQHLWQGFKVGFAQFGDGGASGGVGIDHHVGGQLFLCSHVKGTPSRQAAVSGPQAIRDSEKRVRET